MVESCGVVKVVVEVDVSFKIGGSFMSTWNNITVLKVKYRNLINVLN